MQDTPYIATVALDDTTTFCIDVTNLDAEYPVAQHLFPLGDALAAIRLFGTQLLGQLRLLEVSGATIELGIDFAIESGRLTSLLAKGSTATNAKVTLTWQRSP